MRNRADLLNFIGLCLSVAVMVAIALVAGWAAQAAPAQSPATAVERL